MKLTISYICVMGLILFSCQTPGNSVHSENQPDPLNIASQDSSEKPQSNFYLFANGTWLEKTVIPPSQSYWGSFTILFDSSLNRLHRILDSLTSVSNAPKGSVTRQTSDFYTSAMDSAGIEKKGFFPVKPELDSISAIKTKAELFHEIAREYKINHAPFFNFYVHADDRNSLVNVAHFDQGGLGLPSRDYYFKNDSPTIRIRDAYLNYIRTVFNLLGQSPAEAAVSAKTVFDLETAMAKFSKTPVALRDPIANYNKVIVSKYPEWKQLIAGFGVTADTVLVGQPDFYKGLNALVNNSTLESLKNYLSFHIVNDDADFLSGNFLNAKFDYSKLVTGQTQMKERWKRAITLIDEKLGDNLGRIYVDKYFTAADKDKINQMIDNIMAAYAERIQQLDWMSDSTKQKALIKLRAIVKKIGYPDKWKDYSSVIISPEDVIANIRACANFEYNRNIAKIGKPVDRTEWQMTTPTINAYYEPTENNINFPAGILQPPFYFSYGDDAVNYGAIGVVIGHEITHGFDDQGRQYDADGNLKDWWSSEDASRFKVRAENIIRQYSGYLSVDTFHLNGHLTEGENIADNGGMAIAYAAFKKTPQGKNNEKIDGYTPDQRFFLAHAQVWKTKATNAWLTTRTLTNPHSTPMWRVNGPLSNTPAFYTAFQVQPTDSMYRPDSLRVNIW